MERIVYAMIWNVNLVSNENCKTETKGLWKSVIRFASMPSWNWYYPCRMLLDGQSNNVSLFLVAKIAFLKRNPETLVRTEHRDWTYLNVDQCLRMETFVRGLFSAWVISPFWINLRDWSITFRKNHSLGNCLFFELINLSSLFEKQNALLFILLLHFSRIWVWDSRYFQSPRNINYSAGHIMFHFWCCHRELSGL